MIDYLKIHCLPVLPEKLLNNGLLMFTLSNVLTDGEVLNRWQFAHFKSLEIGIKGNNSKLSGSLHKYRYDGKNWQDFNLSDIQEVIPELSETFEFDPSKAVINFIEIGINIPLDYNPDQIINSLVLHGKERFKELEINRKTKGNGKKSEKDQFTIKVYNKSLQYGLPFQLLRFEIKVKRMKFLERYGIKGLTLADLTRPDIYPKFKTMLLDILSGIVIYNPDIDPDKLTNLNDRELFKLGRYPDHWQQYERRRKNEKSKDLNRFKELAGTKEIIENLKLRISDKWEMLYNQDKITTFQDSNKKDKITTFRKEQTRPVNDKKGQNHTTIKSECVLTCKVTGLTIYNQRPGTKNLTARGVKWYFENEPETYKKRLESLLSEKWLIRHKGEPIETYFSEIYHMIRNKKLNPDNNYFKRYLNIENKGLKLISTFDLLPPEKLEVIKNKLNSNSKFSQLHSLNINISI
jgi:hypothetical protein